MENSKNNELISKIVKGELNIVKNVLATFPLYKGKYIPIGQYTCIAVGTIKKKKVHEIIQIVRCTSLPLIGKHEFIYNNQTILCDIDTFRKEYLHFEDEGLLINSTYVVVEDSLIKLNKIRTRLFLPIIAQEGFAINQFTIDIKPVIIACNGISAVKISTYLDTMITELYHYLRLNINNIETFTLVFNHIMENLIHTGYKLMPIQEPPPAPDFLFDELFGFDENVWL